MAIKFINVFTSGEQLFFKKLCLCLKKNYLIFVVMLVLSLVFSYLYISERKVLYGYTGVLKLATIDGNPVCSVGDIVEVVYFLGASEDFRNKATNGYVKKVRRIRSSNQLVKINVLAPSLEQAKNLLEMIILKLEEKYSSNVNQILKREKNFKKFLNSFNKISQSLYVKNANTPQKNESINLSITVLTLKQLLTDVKDLRSDSINILTRTQNFEYIETKPVSLQPIEPNMKLIWIVFVLVGFFLSIVIVFIIESMKTETDEIK